MSMTIEEEEKEEEEEEEEAVPGPFLSHYI